MIILETRDSHIWNFNKKIVEIIKEAITTIGDIVIVTNAEGPCLDSCKFYETLDDISTKFNIDKKRFIIQTCNTEEIHNKYTIEILNNVWVQNSKECNTTIDTIKNTNLFTVGCFVGKITWPRLVMLAWLDQRYFEKSLITCHYDNNVIAHQVALDLNQVMFEFPEEITVVGDFLKSCPRQINNFKIPIEEQRTLTDEQGRVIVFGGLSTEYANIFLELVSETYYSGLSFFPTEKTFRPILRLTPFIIFGPRGFLSNLKRCGFKTFSNYWDESYDELQGTDRIIAIRSVLDNIFLLSQSQLHDMYTDMLPILIYNKNKLINLSPEELKLAK